MEVSQALMKEAIALRMNPATRDEWLHQLVDLLCNAWGLRRRDDILRAVMEREIMHSTAIGRGVAIPHGKTDAVPRLLIACGIAPKGVDGYETPDGEPVRVGFLLVSPHHITRPHVRALAAVSRIVIKDGVSDRMVACSTPRDLIRLLRNEEEGV